MLCPETFTRHLYKNGDINKPGRKPSGESHVTTGDAIALASKQKSTKLESTIVHSPFFISSGLKSLKKN